MDANEPVDHAAQHERFALGRARWEEAEARVAAAGVGVPKQLEGGATAALADAEAAVQRHGEIVARGSVRAEVLAWTRETAAMFDGLDDEEFAEKVADLEELQRRPVTPDSVLASLLEMVGDDLAWHAQRLHDHVEQLLPDPAFEDAVDQEARRRHAHWERLDPAPTDRIPEDLVEARRWWAQRLRHDRRYVEIRARVRCELGRRPHEPRSRVPIAASRPRERRQRARARAHGPPGRDDPPPDDDDLVEALHRHLQRRRR